MKFTKHPVQRVLLFIFLGFALILSSCASVPKASIELANTVGRDLEEVHRAHRALASLLFDIMEKDINKFIDEIYAPAYIKKFADDYRLDDKVKGIVENAPENLLPVLTRFVEKSYEVIEKKRGELLNPVRSQRNQLIEDIDASHRQLQAAQAIISGHLASVRNVHDAQNDVLKTVGLEGMREKLSENTEKVSNRISCLIEEAEKAEGKMDKVEAVLLKIKETINQIKPEEN